MAVFLGKGWSFPPRFDPRTKQVAMVEAADDIAESLRILLGTNPGERVMLPAYGCGLRRLVFDTLNANTITETRELIRKAILFFEPRITVNLIDVAVSEAMEGRLEILIDYTIRTTNTRH
ncbi:GPW/gp25 family protein, partial [Chitinimonas sp.]|uniref:GPW/gp25 family protein n=1 Tax=Chitinimonas sp. TaxID=1934313 RepID=UPI002F947107